MLTRTCAAAALVAAAILAPAAAPAQERAIAFTNARIHPVAGAPVARGTLVVQHGRVVAVGAADQVPVPAGAEVRDLAGRVVIPGLVDTHSHIGGGDGGDRTAAMHPSVRVLDAIDPMDESIQRAQAGGITTVNVMPGSGLLLSGQTAYLKLRDTSVVTGMLFCRDAVREICGGMKMANGTNPRGAAPLPSTRGRAAAMVRERFVKAQEYRAKVRAAGSDSAKRPPRDLELEALTEVLDGRRTVHFHSHAPQDILTAIRLREEFGFPMVFQHVSEGWKVADAIARARIPVSVTVIDAPGGKEEAYDNTISAAAQLDRAGAEVAFNTDDGITDSRFFLRSAGLGVRAGMAPERALRALTLAPARMMGLEQRLGSLEAGKDADFVILSGDPFSVYTHVLETWIDGRRVFDRANPDDRKFAVGGVGAASSTMHVHTAGDHR